MSGYWKPAPFAAPTDDLGALPVMWRREFFYDAQHRCRGEAERFDSETSYANVPGRRSGAVVSFDAAKAWVERNTLQVVV